MLIMMMIMTITMVLTMMGMPRDCSLCLCEVVAEQLPEEDRVNPSKDVYNMIHSNTFYSLNSSPSLRCVPSARTSPYVPLQKKTQFCDRSRADKQSCIQNLKTLRLYCCATTQPVASTGTPITILPEQMIELERISLRFGICP